VTRSHKFNDRDHSAEADQQPEHIPKFFGKHGFVDTDPKKTKKDGGGKGNWCVLPLFSPPIRSRLVAAINLANATLTLERGHPGEEAQDFGYNMTNPRRRSNSSSHAYAKDFKSKFELVEHEPVFEDLSPEDLVDTEEEKHLKLENQAAASTSSEGQSVEEEHH
jgi:hypothetical protein